MLLVDFALGAKYTLPLGAATAPLYAPLVLYIVLPKSNELLLLVPVKSKELMAADISVLLSSYQGVSGSGGPVSPKNPNLALKGIL
jgi:hypothetical protein